MDAGLPASRPAVINFAPTGGKAGTKVLLQGQHFIGTTSVSFDGVNARFRVLTANYLGVVVPSGAETGKIAVTNAGGTTTSIKPFEIH